MRPETQKWLDLTPVEALLCRDLRHAWPRPPVPRPGRHARIDSTDADPALPPASDGIVWKVLVRGGDTSPRVLERTMRCAAGCGVARVEVFTARPGGRLVRSGKPKLRYPSWYRRTRAEPDEPLEQLDVDVLRGSIVTRLYPGLTW